jgi:hypothetical protein
MKRQDGIVKYFLILSFFNSFILFPSCRLFNKEKPLEEVTETTALQRPPFSADSAYQFIQAQVDFGPRIPGTAAQKKCADYLALKLKQYGATVITQKTNVVIYNGSSVPCFNIIGSFNNSVPRRLLLCSHWDTRPYADQEKNPADQRKKFDSADDGPSGVGVLLEIARQLQLKNPEIGVDIIFFDVEDYGAPAYEKVSETPDTYGLGTQYWCKNPHVPGYKAESGILLDMVGGQGAVFTYEGISMQYAQSLMKQVWKNGSGLGYANLFVRQPTSEIIDDHYYINTIARIPTIDIIHRSAYTPNGFAPHWHTFRDNMQVIDKSVLQAVGETVLSSLYQF